MQYLHTMVRVRDLDEALDFYCNKLGLKEIDRHDNEKGRFTLVFLAAPEDVERAKKDKAPFIELTYNWDREDYSGGRNFGHLAYRVENIYAFVKNSWMKASRSTARRGMAAWLLCALPTAYQSSFCSAAKRCRRKRPGRICLTPDHGNRGAGYRFLNAAL